MTSLAMQLAERAPASLHQIAYRAQQKGLLLTCLLGHQALRLLSRRSVRISRKLEREIQRRYQALLERDLENADEGAYPRSLLFQYPLVDYLRTTPALLLDVPRSWWRMRGRRYRDLPDGVDLQRYPAYFRRNYHWQTDGYLSRKSADLYDVAVEFLFLGTADVMRRMVIPPITRFVREHGSDVRLLDVACGTGRMLHQLALAHPTLRFYGMDLSPYYLDHARDLLRHVEHLSLVADSAEAMPFRDGFFDAVTSVHLLHELPGPVRRRAYEEFWRVLRPGGLLVVEDSAQLSESGEIAFLLGKFSEDFHEPFHREYARDDIGAALERQGFRVESTEPHFVSKVVVARKPA